MEYNKDNPLKVVTLCSGYDSQCLALERLKTAYPEFDYELVAWSEFDPESKTPLNKQPAVIAHNALFPQWKDRNLGDMTKINWGGKTYNATYYSILHHVKVSVKLAYNMASKRAAVHVQVLYGTYEMQ